MLPTRLLAAETAPVTPAGPISPGGRPGVSLHRCPRRAAHHVVAVAQQGHTFIEMTNRRPDHSRAAHQAVGGRDHTGDPARPIPPGDRPGGTLSQ